MAVVLPLLIAVLCSYIDSGYKVRTKIPAVFPEERRYILSDSRAQVR